MNWWILEVSLGINNDLCNDKRYIRGLGFPFSCSTITSSILLAIEIQHHEISSSPPPLALSVSCNYRTLRELLSPPSVALPRFSYLWFSVASRRFCRTLLSCLMVGPSLGHLPSSMGRSQSRVIVEVVAPVALLPGIALSPGIIVRYGRLVQKS